MTSGKLNAIPLPRVTFEGFHMLSLDSFTILQIADS